MNFYKNEQIPQHLKQYFCDAPDRSVWGGDPSCDHDWGDQIPGSNKGGSGTPTDKNNRGEGYGRGEPRGHYCTKCQAWLGQLGLEPSPYEFVSHLVEIFREVKRVLRDDGVLWLNLGDSYANPGIQSSALSSTGGFTGERMRAGKKGTMNSVLRAIPEGIKYKDLVGIPWMTAFALRADGWYLRADIIWSKSNPMPESVTDRPTKAHEYIFLLTKQEHYYYDNEAIKEPLVHPMATGTYDTKHQHAQNNQYSHSGQDYDGAEIGGRNRRSVWNCNTKPYAGSHFAVWPEDLVKPMILAGTGEKGCCPTCGASYKRVVNREWTESTRKSYKGTEQDHWKGLQPTGRIGGFEGGSVTTTGWEPGCECDYTGKNLHTDAQSAARRILSRAKAARDAGMPHDNWGASVTTTGWDTGCACPQPAPPKRCIVLDPFSGSATTGKVANDLGRDYIGLDANASYLDLAVARLQGRAAPQSPDKNEPEESSVMDLFG
jgi:DNA modification methylase